MPLQVSKAVIIRTLIQHGLKLPAEGPPAGTSSRTTMMTRRAGRTASEACSSAASRQTAS
eukprot:3529519-Pleurochrysis_carterae.AAC.3